MFTIFKLVGKTDIKSISVSLPLKVVVAVLKSLCMCVCVCVCLCVCVFLSVCFARNNTKYSMHAVKFLALTKSVDVQNG